MCVAKKPACCLNSSPARCGVLPAPAEPYDILPGWLLACCTKAATVLKSDPGLVVRNSWMRPSAATGLRSFCASNGMRVNSSGLTDSMPVELTSSV